MMQMKHLVEPTRIGHCSTSEQPSTLPSELWLIIFSTDDIISSRDLLSIRLTCRHFACLACALVFTTLRFGPFLSIKDGTSVTPHASKISEDLEALLAVWGSDSIAPCVLECELSPFSDFPYVTSLAPTLRLEDLIPLIHIFFEALPRFVNLNTFKVRRIPFCNMALTNLCQLVNLRTLEVQDCTIMATTIPPPLNVTNITFKSDMPYLSPGDRGSVGWLDVLRIDSLRHLGIDMALPLTTHLRGMTTIQTPESSTADDNASEANAFFDTISLLLSPASSLESLYIKPVHDFKDHNILFHFPKLRAFDGSRGIFERVDTGSDLHSLTLRPLASRMFCLPREILADIQKISSCSNLQSLTIHVSEVSKSIFEAVGANFGGLKKLSIWTVCPRIDDKRVVGDILTSLPRSIEELSLDLYDAQPLWFTWNRWLDNLRSTLRDYLPQSHCRLRRVAFTVCTHTIVCDLKRGDDAVWR